MDGDAQSELRDSYLVRESLILIRIVKSSCRYGNAGTRDRTGLMCEPNTSCSSTENYILQRMIFSFNIGSLDTSKHAKHAYSEHNKPSAILQTPKANGFAHIDPRLSIIV